MGLHLAKRETPLEEKEPASEPAAALTAADPDDNEVFGQGEADVNQNNGSPSEKTAATDSTGAGGPKNAWSDASAADPNAARPHLVRLFSRDAPGRQDNTFKDRPSESDELHTIQEHSGTGTESGSDCAEQDAD
ncbi:myelin basic protein-like isoform X2 [Anguilla rostrata]|uniref:Myelin basic protein n=2 Tax=Anguilla TaxID=7935 RepID=A0A9D3N091_ANGAN|nr:myelin basic protein-like [Anguilla anguilla]KAG5856942.1 hypothetical protein ANANG_G00013260 [Anguilla anguilla]